MRLPICLLLFLPVMTAGSTALAQSTGGVFGPTVSEGSRAVGYRMGYRDEGERFTHRVQYQWALNDSQRLRLLLQQNESGDGDLDRNTLGAQLVWQLTPDGQDHQAGLRFDLSLRDDDRAHRVGVNWINQWTLDDNWRARAIVLPRAEFGDNADDGIFLRTRGQIHRRLGAGRAAGLEIYSAYGSIDDLAAFDDQSHQIGPYITMPVGKSLSLFTSVLIGATDASADRDLKVWIERSL